MPTEADTCRKFVVPALQRAGWENDPHSIGEQRPITDGRIVPRGKGYVRRPPKKADYLLFYRRDFPLAVVEAKKEGTYGTAAMQQAKQYAEMLGLKFAYATNGREIIEFDYFTGLESRLDRFPTSAEGVDEPDADGKQLRVVRLTDYTAEKVRSLCANPEDLRSRWADLEQRANLIKALQDRGIDFQTLALQARKPDADPFDLLCHLAFNAPVLTRRQRAERVKREEGEFFGQFGMEAREILGELLEKYAEDGELQFTLPDVLKVQPMSNHGNINEIVGKFGGENSLLHAMTQLQQLLYAS